VKLKQKNPRNAKICFNQRNKTILNLCKTSMSRRLVIAKQLHSEHEIKRSSNCSQQDQISESSHDKAKHVQEGPQEIKFPYTAYLIHQNDDIHAHPREPEHML
jgi:hypothetical protein